MTADRGLIDSAWMRSCSGSWEAQSLAFYCANMPPMTHTRWATPHPQSRAHFLASSNLLLPAFFTRANAARSRCSAYSAMSSERVMGPAQQIVMIALTCTSRCTNAVNPYSLNPKPCGQVYKRGTRVRVDGSLLGEAEEQASLLPKRKRGHFSILFDGGTQPSTALLVDRDKRTYVDVQKEKKKAKQSPDAEVCAGLGF